VTPPYAVGDLVLLRADPLCGLPEQRAEIIAAYQGSQPLYDARIVIPDRTRNDHDGIVSCTQLDIIRKV